MKPGPFSYHDPRTLDEAVGLLGTLENAKLLAGGQSLMPMLNMRYALPEHVIDINGIAGLGGLDEDEQGGLRIGAMVRQRTLEHSAIIARKAPIMLEALGFLGHFQTRNRGTFGGSLCHLDPAAELPGVAALYDATLSVAGPRGRRDIAISDWPLMYMTPNLEADEILTEIRLPVWREPHGHAFLEISRRHGDFAIAGAGCLLALDGERITRVALVLVGVAHAPLRLSEIEAELTGAQPSQEVLRAAARHARSVESFDDAQTSAAYRRHLAGVLTQRVLAQALLRAREAADV